MHLSFTQSWRLFYVFSIPSLFSVYIDCCRIIATSVTNSIQYMLPSLCIRHQLIYLHQQIERNSNVTKQSKTFLLASVNVMSNRSSIDSSVYIHSTHIQSSYSKAAFMIAIQTAFEHEAGQIFGETEMKIGWKHVLNNNYGPIKSKDILFASKTISENIERNGTRS